MSTTDGNLLGRLGERCRLDPPMTGSMVRMAPPSGFQRKAKPIVVDVVDYSVSGVGLRPHGKFTANRHDTFMLTLEGDDTIICVLGCHESSGGMTWGASFVGTYPQALKALDEAELRREPETEARWNAERR